MNVGQTSGIPDTGAMAQAREAAKATAAALMANNGSQQRQESQTIQQHGSLPLATSGTLGTKINVIA